MTNEKLLALIAKIEKFFGMTIEEIILLLKKRQRRVALEGTDSSGKATQAALLCYLLNLLGVKAKVVSFPDYEQPSCALVENYLSGKFPENLNPKTVATFSTNIEIIPVITKIKTTAIPVDGEIEINLSAIFTGTFE